eukprot:8464001-Alexandrium_andersonii.AAC.1
MTVVRRKTLTQRRKLRRRALHVESCAASFDVARDVRSCAASSNAVLGVGSCAARVNASPAH